MKKYLPFLLVLFLSPFLANSQAEKGVSPTTPSQVLGILATPHSTWAVVVGISDYQDAAIPDLRFADRDAEAFANFLRSPAGGSLDGDHLKVMLNKDATAAQFAIALDWLMENSKEGDNAIVYFSGHGDVEKKTITQPGYLLCWDAPSRVYMAGGAFKLGDLQEVVSTLSIQNKVKVVVITDACRSGTLAGQSIGGAQATAANLAKQYANEIKILSCQPNEYSIEGEQWGGGRGAFSFNLVDALYGLADGNNDLSVTLQEVGRYLEDHVTAEVAPVSQVPMVIGNRTERLASVDPKLLADLRSGRSSQMQMLSPVETRGMEDEVLAGVDTTTRELYRLFKKALKDKVFLEPADACADAYYERLMAEAGMARLHSTMTRNYAAALQDDAQQTLNQWLKTSDGKAREQLAVLTTDRIKQRKIFEEKVKLYPRCLDRAAELLGSKHYMYAALKARKYFFDGYILTSLTNNSTQELGERAMDAFRHSLQWQPEQPQVYWRMSLAFGHIFQNPDSMEYYAQRALEAHPKWVMPIADAAWVLIHKYKQFDLAKSLLEQGTRVDSNDHIINFYWARLYDEQGNFSKAETAYKKAIQTDSTNIACYVNLGIIYTQAGHHAEAEANFKQAIHFDSTNAYPYGNLGNLYRQTRRYAEAEIMLKKALQYDSNLVFVYMNLGDIYESTHRYAEADAAFRKVYKSDTTRSDIVRGFLSLSPDTHFIVTTHHGIYKGQGSDPATMTWEKVLGMDVNNGGNYGWDILHKDSILLAGIDKETGGRRGIYRSTDGGNTWANTFRGGTGLCFFDDGNVIFAGVDYQGIFKSRDLGKTWTAANNGLGDLSPSAFVRAGNNLFASFYGGGIYISADQGDSWSQIAPTAQVYCMEKIDSVLFAGTQIGLMKSEDNGLTWEYVKNDSLNGTAVTTLYAAAGDTLYIGTGSKGLFVSGDFGHSFKPLNNTVGDNRFVSCVAQMNGNLLVGLNQDPGKGLNYYYNPATLGRMLWQYDGNNFRLVPIDWRW